MKLFISITLWCILLVLFWPLALLLLVLFPLVWLLSIPFRLLAIVIDATLILIKALLMFPSRLVARLA